MMTLSVFITLHKPEILKEWDNFAKKLLISKKEHEAFRLRDHAEEIMRELIVDMTKKQSQQQQADKSQDIESAKALPESAANVHGLLRHHDGMTVTEVVAEFRALRATVLRLWLPTLTEMSDEVINDIIRFNEAIDKAVADSIVSYDHQ